VLCQATSRLFPGPKHSQGMQKQFPIVQSQNPIETPADPSKAVPQAPSPGPQYSSQSPQHKPSRDTPSDTPSVESFTQSQLGDDERSEESEPTDQNHPPRTTSLYLKHSLADPESSRSVQILLPFSKKRPQQIRMLGHPKRSTLPGLRRAVITGHLPRQALQTETRLQRCLPTGEMAPRNRCHGRKPERRVSLMMTMGHIQVDSHSSIPPRCRIVQTIALQHPKTAMLWNRVRLKNNRPPTRRVRSAMCEMRQILGSL